MKLIDRSHETLEAVERRRNARGQLIVVVVVVIFAVVAVASSSSIKPGIANMKISLAQDGRTLTGERGSGKTKNLRRPTEIWFGFYLAGGECSDDHLESMRESSRSLPTPPRLSGFRSKIVVRPEGSASCKWPALSTKHSGNGDFHDQKIIMFDRYRSRQPDPHRMRN